MRILQFSPSNNEIRVKTYSPTLDSFETDYNSQFTLQFDRITSVEGLWLIPNKFILLKNYPNPFNPSTTISYSIPKSDFVILKIYNMVGREIQTLFSEFQYSGTYSINFDARNLSSGIYFYRLQVGKEFVETKKMLLMR